MRREAVSSHVRRYPWWYGTGLVWLLAMLTLPVVHAHPLGVFSADQPSTVAAGPGSTVAPTVTTPLAAPVTGGAPNADGTDPIAIDTSVSTVAPSSSAGDQALELVPPEVLDLIFDALPALEVPALPPEFAALANAIAPVATYGCSGLGLASVVVAVVAQSAQGVPVERLLPYLSPVVTACAAFPIPAHRTVCEADKPFIVDLGGLTKSPPILGLGIDQIDAMESLLASAVGPGVPRLAPQLRAQLDCKLVSEL